MDLNITDSIAVAVTLLMRKWNSDIDKEISLLKKEIKKYKTDKKKNELKERIEFLVKLKKEGKDGENDCL
jgi:DNA-binding transcriptional regulator GbsR (MarR family)